MDKPKKYRNREREINCNEIITALQYTGNNIEAIKAFCPTSKHSGDKDFTLKGAFKFTDQEYEDGFFSFEQVFGKRFLNKNQWLFEYGHAFYIHDDHRFKILFEEVIDA
jgi:hypothetical protein